MRGMGKSHISWACEDPRRGGMVGEKGMGELGGACSP